MSQDPHGVMGQRMRMNLLDGRKRADRKVRATFLRRHTAEIRRRRAPPPGRRSGVHVPWRRAAARPRRRGRVVEEHSSSSVDEITIATPPIIVACTNARSALSAKYSMNTKMITALSTSTIQSGTGITPSAPWVRSARASSRSERSSSHFAYAVCSDGGPRLDGH